MNKNTTQFAIIGLGRMGISIAETLSQNEYEVLAIDTNKELVDEIANTVTRAVQADATDINTLRSLGIPNFDVVIIAIGEDIESNIMTAVLLKELGVKYTIAKAKNKRHKKVLEKIGIDKVILPEAEMGIRIATNLMNHNILDFIEFSSDYSIMELAVKPEWIDKTLKELDLRKTEGINIIAIKKLNKVGQIDVTPAADYKLKSDDIIVAIVAEEKK